MRIVIPRALTWGVLIGFGVVSAGYGQTAFKIIGIGPNSDPLAGVYTDPYTGQVSGSISSVWAYCDDFQDNVTPGESWTANDTGLNQFTSANNVSSVYYTGSTTYSLTSHSGFSGLSGTYTQTTDYIAAAMLAVQATNILNNDSGNPNSTDDQALSDLSFALWGIFDPTLLTQQTNSDGTLPQSDWTTAQNELKSALNGAATFIADDSHSTNYGSDYENLPTAQGGLGGATINIYTPTGPSGCNTCTTPESGSGRPQEFITVSLPTTGNSAMPESSSWAMLAFDMIGAGVIGFIFRRRQLRNRA